MPNNDISLIAHLQRRAGFGATREELEVDAARGYEAVVDNLINPERFPDVDEDLIDRYYGGEAIAVYAGKWFYRMVNTKRPLQEKMALFLHQLLPAGWGKSEHGPSMFDEIDMFRRVGLTDMRTILLELSKDPAMIFWLDNNENHKYEPNENYGRELLELFSMGVGNYTEHDIKMAARAFTGWTFTQPIPIYPNGHYPAEFEYRDEDHDSSIKTFLGEEGYFNGEDIIDIIVRQQATARFISRHLYNFFVADEPQVPAWEIEPPQDPAAINTLVKAYFDSDGDMRSMLRVLFNSDFFKEARGKKVKSPTELVAGILKLVGTYRSPEPEIAKYAGVTTVMGQQLLNPPTVEGWHTGKEWIDGGTLNERINFAVDEVGDVAKPGVRSIIERVCGEGSPISPEELMVRCLDLAGPLTASDETRDALLRNVEPDGQLRFDSEAEREKSQARIVNMLQLIVATKEYQFA